LKSASLQYANALADVALSARPQEKSGAESGDRQYYKDPATAFEGFTLVSAGEYTEAVIQKASKLAKELDAFGALYAESAELRTFLASPAVIIEAKHAVIEKLIERLGASKIIRNFLFVIADNRRMHLLPEIIETFRQVLRQRQKIAEAEVTSAVELSATQKKDMAKTLANLTGQKVETTYLLDPALLGGAVVRIGDTIYDGSLRSRLNELRARLAAE